MAEFLAYLNTSNVDIKLGPATGFSAQAELFKYI